MTFLDRLLRFLVMTGVVFALLFLLNTYFAFWRGWPGVDELAAHYGWFGKPTGSLGDAALSLGWWQFAFYAVGMAGCALFVLLTPNRLLQADAELLSELAAYIVRGSFWGVFLVGLADAVISFLRVEGLLAQTVGEQLASDLGRSAFRGVYVHYPLLGIGFAIAAVFRNIAFVWLALLVVVAEFQIVISRFVFSYEQAFMGDLVRFWYASLFLLGSAYTLVEEGHVRVDVLYAHFSERGRAWTNAAGSILLGLPLCWVVLTQGLWSKGSSIASPMLSYEITQTGFGMYAKYLMAGLLIMFALSMTAQFSALFLSSVAILRDRRTQSVAPADAAAN